MSGLVSTNEVKIDEMICIEVDMISAKYEVKCER